MAQRFRRRSDNEIREGCECFGKSLLGVHGFEPRRSQAIFFYLFNLFSKEKLIVVRSCNCISQLNFFFETTKKIRGHCKYFVQFAGIFF